MAIRYGRGVEGKLALRVVSHGEVLETLASGVPGEAHSGREARVRVFPFHAQWEGRFYDEKQVRVIFREEAGDVIVVSVIARYGRFP